MVRYKKKIMYQIEELRKRDIKVISRAATAVFAVCAAIAAIFILLFAKDWYNERRFDIKEAKKIGNWEAPSKDYVVQDLSEIEIGNGPIRMVRISDEDSGNTFSFFKEFFSGRDFLRASEKAHSEILKKYGLDNFYTKTSDVAGNYGSDIRYSAVGWNSSEDKRAGIIGSLICPGASGNIDVVFIIAENDNDKYDNDRALEFIRTLKCNAPGEIIENKEIGDQMDTDGDDLPDKVEEMIKSDPYNPDTDGDGYIDGNEIKNSYSPLIPSVYGKYASEEFEKVKRDILDISPDVYKKLFEAPLSTPASTPSLTSSVAPELSGVVVPSPTPSSAVLKIIKLSNKDWSYALYVPPGVNPKESYPLVLGLHGTGGAALDYVSYWRETADKNGFIVAVLQAYDKKYPSGNVVESYPWSEASGFALSVMRDVEKQYKLDENKIFLTGYSTGAITSYIAALSGEVKFKGIIPIDGYLPLEAGIVDELINSKDLNFYVIHGSSDIPDKDMKSTVEQEKTLIQYGAKMTFRILSDIPSNEYPMAEQENIAKWMNGLP